MMLNEEEFGEVIEAQGSVCTCMDPSLRHDMAPCVTFFKDQCDSGMVQFTDKPEGLLTPFCVTKKSGKHRLILDCKD